MHVEDEYGNDIDLNDLNDDRDPEPPDEEPSLSLEEIAGFLVSAQGGSLQEGYDRDAAKDLLVDLAVPQMLAELRHWRSLEKDSQHAVTFGDPNNPVQYFHVGGADEAAELASAQNGTDWVRDVYRDAWERPAESQFSDEPPF